jgi:hypothetical protein
MARKPRPRKGSTYCKEWVGDDPDFCDCDECHRARHEFAEIETIFFEYFDKALAEERPHLTEEQRHVEIVTHMKANPIDAFECVSSPEDESDA